MVVVVVLGVVVLLQVLRLVVLVVGGSCGSPPHPALHSHTDTNLLVLTTGVGERRRDKEESTRSLVLETKKGGRQKS